MFTSLLLQASGAAGSATGGMADFVTDLSNTIGIDLFDEDIDNVVFQTNEFLCNSDFIGSQGPFWRLLVVAVTNPPKYSFNLCKSATYYFCFCYHICRMFYCVKYFSISIMRFKITSALVLHRFMKISLRRMFSRSVSGRPLRKPNNFCISPLASERLFKASISLSVKRCLGYLPSNRLRAYALVVSPQRVAYSAISL